MPVQVAVILAFAAGWFSGMAYLRASRADRADKLCATIASLRAELAHERLKTLSDWLFEDEA